MAMLLERGLFLEQPMIVEVDYAGQRPVRQRRRGDRRAVAARGRLCRGRRAGVDEILRSDGSRRAPRTLSIDSTNDRSRRTDVRPTERFSETVRAPIPAVYAPASVMLGRRTSPAILRSQYGRLLADSAPRHAVH